LLPSFLLSFLNAHSAAGTRHSNKEKFDGDKKSPVKLNQMRAHLIELDRAFSGSGNCDQLRNAI